MNIDIKHWIVSVAAVAGACSPATTQDPASPATPVATSSMAHSVDATQRPKNPPAIPQKDRTSLAGRLEHSAYYYEGGRKRTVWQSDELVAEFKPTEQSAQAMRQLAPESEIVPSSTAFVRLWHVKGMQAARALRELPGFAPVYHDLDSAAAPKRSLPGDVIVYLDPSWDRARADEWARSQDVAIAKELPIHKNAFVITTAPGQAALDLANRLQESGTVVSATPNWWRDAALR
jgi:hypothetical protein